MCFVLDDHDWTAAVEEDEVTVAAKVTTCDECHCKIHPGQWVRRIFQQQRESCRVCQRTDDDDENSFEEPAAEPCPEGECDFGETFRYERCEQCDKLLRAIKAAELAAGCRERESQPYLTQLFEAMVYEENDYGETARQLFPELAMSGHLFRFGERFYPLDGLTDRDLEPVHELGGEG